MTGPERTPESMREAHGAKRARVTLLARRRLTGLIRTVLLAAGTSATESKATSSLLDLKPTWRGGTVPEKRVCVFERRRFRAPRSRAKLGRNFSTAFRIRHKSILVLRHGRSRVRELRA